MGGSPGRWCPALPTRCRVPLWWAAPQSPPLVAGHFVVWKASLGLGSSPSRCLHFPAWRGAGSIPASPWGSPPPHIPPPPRPRPTRGSAAFLPALCLRDPGLPPATTSVGICSNRAKNNPHRARVPKGSSAWSVKGLRLTVPVLSAPQPAPRPAAPLLASPSAEEGPSHPASSFPRHPT